jgi:hypothetical protein
VNPYPGLRPFRPDEENIFCGRDLDLKKMENRTRISPLTIMHARSGVGKSSFLNCRLIPTLKNESKVCYVNEWGSESPEKIVKNAVEELKKRNDKSDEYPVLALDQFEDVFKMQYDRRQLWDTLAELINIQNPDVHVLISMRDEWLGACGEAWEYLPDGATATVRLSPLLEKDLRAAIVTPAKHEGSKEFSSHLVKVLLEDLLKPSAFGVGGKNIEPGLLQLVCYRLWEESVKRNIQTIDIDLYAELGKVDQIIREFVQNKLTTVGKECPFDSFQRVLWVGLTRHLVLSQGVKAIVSPRILSKKLNIKDLGMAGSASLYGRKMKKEKLYLNELVEERGEPSLKLMTEISNVLDKGVQVGFLKKQRCVAISYHNSVDHSQDSLYEVSHDALTPIFQQFALDFETQLRTRIAMMIGLAFACIILTPLCIADIIAEGLKVFLQQLPLRLVIGLAIAVLYVTIIIICSIVLSFFSRIIIFPIIRGFAKFRVVIKIKGARKKSHKFTRFILRLFSIYPR